MNHIIRCTLLLFLCSFFTSGYGAAFALPTAPPQHGMVDNLVGGINRLRGKQNFHLTPQDAFSRLMGDALVKARGKISLEQVSTAEIYFNEVFSHGSPAMQKGLTEMTFVLGKELDKVYFSSGTKYRALSNLLREVFSHLRAVAIQDEELAAQKRSAQPTPHFEQRTQVERLFLLYRSLQSVATAVSDGVRQWLGRLPWIKMLLGAGAIYGGVKLYKNKTIPKIWEMAKSAKAFFDSGTTMMREQERQQRAFFEEHAEIDWVATVNNAKERDATELSEKYEVHVVKYKKPQSEDDIGQFVYLIKQDELPAGYPDDFKTAIRTAYKNSKNSRSSEQQREESHQRVLALLEQWKQRIAAYRGAATDAHWIHLPPSTIDRLAAAGKALAPVLKESTDLLRQSRLQQEAWYAHNNIAKEIFNREERRAMRSTLKVLSHAEERHFYRKAEQMWRAANPGAAPDRDGILRTMGPLVLKNENNYEMRYVQFDQIDETDVESIQQSLEAAGHFGWYYNREGNKVTPTIYKGRGDLFTSQERGVPNIQSTGLHRTLLPTRNIVEQVLNRVFDPLTDRESALGGILHESHSLMERNRLDGENWLKGINPVYTDEQRMQPMIGWPRPGEPEYTTHKYRQYFVGTAVSDYPHGPAADGEAQRYRHYPSENILQGLTKAIGSINHAGSPVGSFLGTLGGTLANVNESTLTSLSRYLEKDGAGNLIRPIRLKPGVERRRVHAPGTEHHDRYYLVFVNAAGKELLSESGHPAPDDGSHHEGRYIEDSGINGLWDALSSLSHNRGTDMSRLLDTADGIVGALGDEDPARAQTYGRNLQHIAQPLVRQALGAENATHFVQQILPGEVLTEGRGRTGLPLIRVLPPVFAQQQHETTQAYHSRLRGALRNPEIKQHEHIRKAIELKLQLAQSAAAHESSPSGQVLFEGRGMTGVPNVVVLPAEFAQRHDEPLDQYLTRLQAAYATANGDAKNAIQAQINIVQASIAHQRAQGATRALPDSPFRGAQASATPSPTRGAGGPPSSASDASGARSVASHGGDTGAGTGLRTPPHTQ